MIGFEFIKIIHYITHKRIVLGLGTACPGNFTQKLHRVSEHEFLLFIHVLLIHTRPHNENSFLGMSQITITTFIVLMSNNNHNQ